MGVWGRRLLATIGIVAISAWLAVPAAGAKPSRSLRFPLRLPTPGHVTLQTLSVKVKGGGPAPPALVLPNAKRLPPSIRVLWARRTTRKAKQRTYSLAVLVLNQKGGASRWLAPFAVARAAAEEQRDVIGQIILAWVLKYNPDPVPQYTAFSIPPGFRGNGVAVKGDSVTNIDAASAKTADKITGTPAMEYLGELTTGTAPDVDTGYYDDGHAFGWKVQTKADERIVWKNLLHHLISQESGSLVDQVEADIRADLDADGVIGPLSAPGSGGTTTGGGGTSTGGGGTSSDGCHSPNDLSQVSAVSTYDETTAHVYVKGAIAALASCAGVLDRYSIRVRDAVSGDWLYCHDGSVGPPGDPQDPNGAPEPPCSSLPLHQWHGMTITAGLAAPGTAWYCSASSAYYCFGVEGTGPADGHSYNSTFEVQSSY